jgi:hypothetical protein
VVNFTRPLRDIISALTGATSRKIVFFETTTLTSKTGDPVDPWGHEYLIDTSAKPFPPHVWSRGPDGIDQRGKDESDDVASWN